MHMAASYMNTPLSNRYTNEEETKLPTGRCNFTNLSSGANAPKCGCRRFWDKALGTPHLVGGNGTGFCMCEHHACFHDDAPEGESASTPRMLSGLRTSQIQVQIQKEQNSGRPQDSLPDTLRWNQFVTSGSSAGIPPIPSQCLLPSENASTTSGSQSRYSRPFGGLGLNTLSHIPKPGTGTGIITSTETSRKQVFEDADGNKFLQSLTEVATPSVRASQEPNHEVDFGKTIASAQEVLEKIAEAQSQTVVALRDCRDDASSILIKQSGSNPETNSFIAAPSEVNESYLIPRLRNIVNTLAEYPTKIQNHEHRLHTLENGSFVHGTVEDLQDANDKIDTRCGDLEERMREVEKVQAALNDLTSVSDRNAGSSFSSRASESSSAMITSAIDASRIEALEAQVAELQASALPSHLRPWEVEVVFLPYGPRLMGIWSSQHGVSQRSRLSSSAPDEWTQTQLHYDSIAAAAQARLADHDRVSAWERSANHMADNREDDQAEWFFARACGRGSRADMRLRSRGLVKRIEIRGPDARNVQEAITTAFGDLPDLLAQDCFSQRDENAGEIPKKQRQYLALQASYIPLRKVHKESRLRFLTPSEMVTQALWTVPFLSSSVAMRHSNIRRLYVTHRDSYIQHLGHQTSDWTWAKLRQLPRIYPDAPEAHTPEADAEEPCWEFDDRLDPPGESVHSSFASQISELSIESPGISAEGFEQEELMSRSDHFSSAPLSRNTSTTPTSVAPPPPLSPLKERNPFRPFHGRTASMPTMVPAQGSKRRIASFDRESDIGVRSSPTPVPVPLNLSTSFSISKRRRISRSPSRPRNTPRWSNGPPSPFDMGMVDGRERGLTPFAYATPHSNAPYAGPRSTVDVYEDGDDEEQDQEQRHGSTTDQEDDLDDGAEGNALSDYDSGEHKQYRQLEDEWEGVDDQEATEAGSDAGSEVPSEYPSTQQRPEESRGVKTEKGFRIHVDDDLDEMV